MAQGMDFSHIPIIDVSDLVAGRPAQRTAAKRIGEACRESGFFYVVGHGVSVALQERLRELSRVFFAQDLETKLAIRMSLGGRAWRGYFRVGDELTSGKPDQKEGLYFGEELPADDPRVSRATLDAGRMESGRKPELVCDLIALPRADRVSGSEGEK